LLVATFEIVQIEQTARKIGALIARASHFWRKSMRSEVDEEGKKGRKRKKKRKEKKEG